jgi:PBP1b-binding outer membrane lipoprotein LpoB
MMNVNLSFTLDGSGSEIMAQLTSLMAALDPTLAVVVEPVKVKKAKRILTEAQKKVIRDRFALGRENAAKAREAEAKAKVKAVVKAKPKSEVGLPIAKTGAKVAAKAAAE